MSPYRRQISSLTLFVLLPIILTQRLQSDSCCDGKIGSSRSKLISITDGCICKEVSDGYSLCYNVNNNKNSCKKYPKRIKINTTELILRSTSINEILESDFSNLEHLESLTLDQNFKIRRIQENAFENMKDLKTLNIISSPLLNNFHPDTFKGLMNLKELKVAHCGFVNIQALTIAIKISILPNLQKLNITGNSFVNVTSHDFESLVDTPSSQKPPLEELDLSSCKIETIDKIALNPLRSLSSLHIGKNNLTVDAVVDLLETAVSSNLPLTSLDLHSFGINGTVQESLSKAFNSLGLKTLTLSGNQFDVLEKNTISTDLPMLTTLDLSNVMTTFLDSSFFTRTPMLDKLVLNKHNLSYFTIPRNLPKLKYLDLSEFTRKGYWEFFHLQTEVDLSDIEYLDLHSTRLAFLQKDAFKFMPNLKELNLKSCMVTKISTGAFEQLNNLKLLNLEDNKFIVMYQKYPSEPFMGLENLETLLVGGNNIRYIRYKEKNLFQHLTNLKCLGLQRNSLEVITSSDFDVLPNLEVLDISSNPLYAWDGRVFFKEKLEKLYVSYNHFTYLSQAMLQDFRNITTLDIDYSPFSCDCRMMRRMYMNKILLREMKESPRYKNLLCAGSHELTVLSFLETTNYADCEPKRSHMMYFFGVFLGISLLAAILILVYIVRDQIPYANAFVRSTESRRSIL